MSEIRRNLLQRAKVAVDRDGPNPVLAWLDGYAAGHADATGKALEVMLDLPGDDYFDAFDRSKKSVPDDEETAFAPPIDDGPEDNWGGF